MGYLKLFLNFTKPEGVKEAMRMSYRKALNLARQQEVQNAHQEALIATMRSRYELMGFRYKAKQQHPSEAFLRIELIPFFAMEEKKSIEVLAEYILYKERNMWSEGEINTSLITKEINKALVKVFNITSSEAGIISQHVEWYEVINEENKERIFNQV